MYYSQKGSYADFVRSCNEIASSCQQKEHSGKEFNEMYNNTKFYKFLNNNLIHNNNFQYKLGLNVDTIPLYPVGPYPDSGLYFCEESKCHLHWKSYGTKIALLEIPDDARVHVREDAFKADRYIIKEIINFDDMSDDFWLNILRHDSRALKYIKNQTEEMCILAVKQNGLMLEYVRNQTNKICGFAYHQNNDAFRFVKSVSIDIFLQYMGMIPSYSLLDSWANDSR